MTTRNIGGTLNWATLYGREQHRPTDGEALQAECRRMHREGLKPRDIAVALKIGVAAVLQALELAAEAQ